MTDHGSPTRSTATPAVVVLLGFTTAILLLGLPWLNVDGRRVTGLAIPVLAVIAAFLARPQDHRRARSLRSDHGSTWRAALVLTTMAWAAAALLLADAVRDGPSFLDEGPRRLFQFAVLFGSAAVATELSLRRRAAAGLAYVGPLVVVVTWLLFWRFTVQNDVSIAEEVRTAIDERDPQPIFRIFGRSYIRSGIGYLEGAAPSLRHVTVRSGIVAALLGSAMAALVPSRRRRWAAGLGLLLAAFVAVVTLSRLNIAVLAVVGALFGLRILTWKRAGLVVPVAVSSTLLAGFAAVAGFRFVDRSTNSGGERTDRLRFALDHLDEGAFSGLDRVVDGELVQSPHNTVLDLWLGGGILAAAAGFALLGMVGWWTARAAARTVRAGTGLELQLQASILGLCLVALMRILAGGGGLLDPLAWMGLGAAIVLMGVPDPYPELRREHEVSSGITEQPHVVMTMVSPLAYGAGRVVCEYAGALAESGHRVTLAYDAGELERSGDRPTVLPELESSGVATVGIAGLSGLRSLRPGGRVEREVAALRPDLLVSTQLRSAWPTVSLGRRIGVASVVLAQNLPRFAGRWPVGIAKRLVYRRAVSAASLVVCVAQQVADELAADFGVDRERIEVVSNGIDPGPEPARHRSDRERIRSEFGIDEGHLFVNIGRLHPQKGHVHLIEAASQLQARHDVGPFRVIVVGGTESEGGERLRATLEAQIAERGLSDVVQLVGYRHDTRTLLECADGFVLSSLWEGGPSLAALEAMAARCPVVLSDYGSRLDGFTNGVHGFYVPAGDADAMSDALRTIMTTSSEELSQIGTAARAYVIDRRSLEAARLAFVARIDQLIDELIEQPSDGGSVEST